MLSIHLAVLRTEALVDFSKPHLKVQLGLRCSVRGMQRVFIPHPDVASATCVHKAWSTANGNGVYSLPMVESANPPGTAWGLPCDYGLVWNWRLGRRQDRSTMTEAGSAPTPQIYKLLSHRSLVQGPPNHISCRSGTVVKGPIYQNGRTRRVASLRRCYPRPPHYLRERE